MGERFGVGVTSEVISDPVTAETMWIALGHSSTVIDWDDLSWLKRLRCKNHHKVTYLSKNPWIRGLHITTDVEHLEEVYREFGKPECNCPFSDLEVFVELKQ